MRIAIVYSMPTRRALSNPSVVTDEDTKASAQKVARALTLKGAEVDLVPVTEDSLSIITGLRVDCIFNLIEWDDGDLPLSEKAFTLMEALHIPITGASKENYFATTDKVLMKKAFDEQGVPTAKWQIFAIGNERVREDFTFPVIVKLTKTHCSVGLTHDAVVKEYSGVLPIVQKRLAEYKEPVLVEEFIDGQEFQVTLLAQEDGVHMLPPAEITFTTKGTEAFLTFEGRWVEGAPDYQTSDTKMAHLTPAQLALFQRVSRATFENLGFSGYARLDVRMRQEKGADVLYILEANSNPGLDDSPQYSMTMSAKAIGLTFADFIWEIVLAAMRKPH